MDEPTVCWPIYHLEEERVIWVPKEEWLTNPHAGTWVSWERPKREPVQTGIPLTKEQFKPKRNA